jgi:hypothetical protein
MIARFVIPLCTLGLAAMSPASAAEPISEKPAADPNERICRIVPVTGSRVQKRKICRTRKQWEDAGSGTSETVGDFQRIQSGLCGLRPC